MILFFLLFEIKLFLLLIFETWDFEYWFLNAKEQRLQLIYCDTGAIVSCAIVAQVLRAPEESLNLSVFLINFKAIFF